MAPKPVRRVDALVLPRGLQLFDDDANKLVARAASTQGTATPDGGVVAQSAVVLGGTGRKLEVMADRVELPPPPPRPTIHHERSADPKFFSGLADVGPNLRWGVYASMTAVDAGVDLRRKLARKRRGADARRVRSFDKTVDSFYWEDGKSRDDTKEDILLYVPLRAEAHLTKEHVTVEFGPRSVSFVAAVPQPGGDGVVHTYRLKLEPLSHEIVPSLSRFAVRTNARTVLMRMRKAEETLTTATKWYGLTPSSAVPPSQHGPGPAPERFGAARELADPDHLALRRGPGR